RTLAMQGSQSGPMLSTRKTKPSSYDTPLKLSAQILTRRLQLNNGDAASGDLDSDAALVIVRSKFQLLIVSPFRSLSNLLAAQAERNCNYRLAIDFSQPLLRLEYAAVVEKRDHPAARVAIHQVLDVAVDLDGRSTGRQMHEQVSCKWRNAFVFAQQIGHGHKDELAASDFVHGHQRIIRRCRDQNLCAFQLDLLVSENLTV